MHVAAEAGDLEVLTIVAERESEIDAYNCFKQVQPHGRLVSKPLHRRGVEEGSHVQGLRLVQERPAL